MNRSKNDDLKDHDPAADSGNYSIPERVKYMRQQRQLSQKELAQKSRLSQSTIAQIETGRMDPSIKTLEKIAEALDIEPAIFFTKNQVFVFDLLKLRAKYDHVDKLNPTIYKALDQVIRYAGEIGFFGNSAKPSRLGKKR